MVIEQKRGLGINFQGVQSQVTLIENGVEMALRLAACLLNISEARNRYIVEKIAKAACSTNILSDNWDKNFKCSSTVLNIFSDHEYNRSVLTIAAPVENLESCVTNACMVAYKAIDLRDHHGQHPRLGAVDLVPIYPISSSVSLNLCGEIARAVGRQIIEHVPGTSVFFFGAADQPKERGLVERRKEVGWYKGKHGMCYDNVNYDLGTRPTSKYGCTGVGASPYVMNCNVTIETDDLVVGRTIAKKIRGSNLGLPGVQAMAFKHEGCIEIACNVESYAKEGMNEDPTNQSKQSILHYTSPNEIKERIRALASEYGIGVKGTTVVGFTPNEIYHMACKALSQGDSMAWKNIQHHHM